MSICTSSCSALEADLSFIYQSTLDNELLVDKLMPKIHKDTPTAKHRSHTHIHMSHTHRHPQVTHTHTHISFTHIQRSHSHIHKSHTHIPKDHTHTHTTYQLGRHSKVKAERSQWCQGWANSSHYPEVVHLLLSFLLSGYSALCSSFTSCFHESVQRNTCAELSGRDV